MAQRDIVLRWIEQLGRVIARLIRSGTAADLDIAADQIEEAITSLLGPLTQLVPRIDVASSAELLHDPERIFAWAQLMDLSAAIAIVRNQVGAAEQGRARALAAACEAVRRSADPPAEWHEWIAARGGGDRTLSSGT